MSPFWTSHLGKLATILKIQWFHNCLLYHLLEHVPYGLLLEGAGGILQIPNSDVILEAPEEVHGFIYGLMHTDPTGFLPKSKHLISPIADYHFILFDQGNSHKRLFKIKFPHGLKKKKHLANIKVSHGDIHKNIPFKDIPSLRDLLLLENPCFDHYFEVDEQYAIVSTINFSQFCLYCDRPCEGEAKALVFGSMKPPQFPPTSAALRVYVASPKYGTRDFNQVLPGFFPVTGNQLIWCFTDIDEGKVMQNYRQEIISLLPFSLLIKILDLR